MLLHGGRTDGLTLMEILLALAILAVLAALVVPRLIGRQQRALIQATRLSIRGLEGAARLYAAQHDGEYPQGAREKVFAQLQNPQPGPDGRPRSPYLEQPPRDAWEQLLFYEYPTTRHGRVTKPAIWSAGPNRRNEQGGGDDISNWSADYEKWGGL